MVASLSRPHSLLSLPLAAALKSDPLVTFTPSQSSNHTPLSLHLSTTLNQNCSTRALGRSARMRCEVGERSRRKRSFGNGDDAGEVESREESCW